jgi:hypothetical protein
VTQFGRSFSIYKSNCSILREQSAVVAFFPSGAIPFTEPLFRLHSSTFASHLQSRFSAPPHVQITPPCLCSYGTTLEIDAFSFISLIRMRPLPSPVSQRLHKKWAPPHRETRAGRFYFYSISCLLPQLEDASKLLAHQSLADFSLLLQQTIVLPQLVITRIQRLFCYVRHLTPTSTHFIMPSPWNQENERKLLLCLVDSNIKPDWAEVATSMGSDFTDESVR